MASRIWKLRITDVMQSTIFGFLTKEMDGCEALYTRCDYDPIFGTVVNRFLTQTVIGHPLTVYGKGNQRTGLMALKDSINSLASMLYNPPAAGIHKVINNTTETNFSINELSETIKSIAGEAGYHVKVIKTHDPRLEQSDTKLEYNIDTDYSGHGTFHTPMSEITKGMLKVIERFKDNIVPNLFIPNVKWYAEISSMIKPPSSLGNAVLSDEAYWELFREQYFHSERINLNPGTLGSTSTPVKQKRNHQHLIKDPEGYPLGSYESGRKSLEVISDLCKDLWPSTGYNLAVTHSTSQTMNLMALAMLRKFHQESTVPYKVFTTTHEHEGGIGCFQYLPEFELFFIEDNILADPNEMKRMLVEIQPHIAFFSHLQYDTGNIAPVEEWCNIVRAHVPGCKIILDVAQSLGLYDIPFGQADVVLGSTHKWLFGPHGGGLMWMTSAFQKWIEAIYWSGHGLTHDPKVANISIPGGQDFRLYPAIEEALQLYQQTGTAIALNRSSYLGAYFQKRLDELFSNCGIGFTFLNNNNSTAVISIAFTDYDPYPLYKFLNDQMVHTKCIKNHKIAGAEYHIIRIGIPYYETMERLNYALFEIGRYLSENKPVVSEEALVTY
jgi:UDP-sulfoquinovose synthase